MSFKTTIGQNLEQVVQQELNRMDSEWFLRWHFIGKGESSEIDSFNGTPIRYGGLSYSGTVVDVYWATISRYRKLKVQEYFNLVENELQRYPKYIRRQAINEATGIVKMFAASIQRRAIEKNRILLGDGINFPKAHDFGNWEGSNSMAIERRSAALMDAYCEINLEQGEYYVIKNMMKEELSFLKADGSGQVDGIKGLVTGNKLITFDTSLPVQPNDRFLRNLPSGLVEEYIVENPRFQQALTGMEAHFQVDIRRSDAPVASAQTVINNINGDNARINMNSVDNSHNVSITNSETAVFQQLRDALIGAELEDSESTQILAAIEAMEASKDTPAFKEKYQSFMAAAANHVSVFAPMLAALASFL